MTRPISSPCPIGFGSGLGPGRVAPRRVAGFTLVELLVVIVILGILVGLLVPVIAGAVNRANEAQVKADIELIANGLARFKLEYGDYPPSRIILSETGDYLPNDTRFLDDSTIPWLGNVDLSLMTKEDLRLGQLGQRSIRFMKKFFPRAVLGPNGPVGDFNGNGIVDQGLIYLQGDECLAFFLGGIPDNQGETIAMIGFTKDPTRPFQNVLATGSRRPVLLEFQAGRLIDFDGDGMPSYTDTMSGGNVSDARPYAYFSSYGQGGYDPNDVNLDATWGGTYAVPYLGLLGTTSASPNPYTSGKPIFLDTNGNIINRPPAWINANTFQIISAGRDRVYGPGGQYLATSNSERLPVDELTGRTAEARRFEADNLTNFASNKLD